MYHNGFCVNRATDRAVPNETVRAPLRGLVVRPFAARPALPMSETKSSLYGLHQGLDARRTLVVGRHFTRFYTFHRVSQDRTGLTRVLPRLHSFRGSVQVRWIRRQVFRLPSYSRLSKGRTAHGQGITGLHLPSYSVLDLTKAGLYWVRLRSRTLAELQLPCGRTAHGQGGLLLLSGNSCLIGWTVTFQATGSTVFCPPHPAALPLLRGVGQHFGLGRRSGIKTSPSQTDHVLAITQRTRRDTGAKE